VASLGPRSLAAVVLAALVLAFAAALAGRTHADAAPPPAAPAYARAFDGQAGPARIDRKRIAQVVWRGGQLTASTGEAVWVFVSASLPLETPEKWAEFVAKLAHGPEIADATMRIATLAEIEELCGASALGCYGFNEILSIGEPSIDGTTPEEVVRHEYGHHVAFHRVNPPWQSIDWGPKQWASAANVCARVARGEAFPGDGGRNYAQNPGEAWAETYRLFDERRNGITDARWPIISPSFFPSEAALQAAERDVLQPWTKGTTTTFRRNFGKSTKKVWLIPLKTGLDGALALTASLPREGTHEVALVAANRRTVIRRAQWVGQRSKRSGTTVCGQRSLFVRVTQSGALGRVAVTVSTP
jgi:hypothetical protein